MSFRYTKIQINSKKIYRKMSPVPKSPWTMGEVEDICMVNLVPPEKLKEFFSRCIKILQKIKGQNIGDYLEFGVFNGASLSSMYLTAKKHNLKSTRFFGFDAFMGLPKGSENEDDGVWKKGFYACSFEKMKECLKRKGINPKEINWVKGWYKDTLTDKTIKKFKIKKLGIIFIDCDTYSSSKAVLDFLYPLITEEVILCFDDWKLNDLDIKELGEYKSFNEFLDKHPNLEAKEIKSYNRKSRSFLVKPINKK
jgi:O-methyltransferase